MPDWITAIYVFTLIGFGMAAWRHVVLNWRRALLWGGITIALYVLGWYGLGLR